MAGIEQLEIHSKSYIVRWVKVEDGHTISWSVQPHKKSINFGIVKHPGSGSTNLTANQDDEPTDQLDAPTEGGGKKGAFAKRDSSTAQEQLSKKGFRVIDWHGKCEADKVSMGTYDVDRGHGGMFGLIFDNTFSKQTSKTATFVLLTYPTGAPPKGSTHLPNLPSATTSKTSLGGNGAPSLRHTAAESVDSLHSQATRGRATSNARSERSIAATPGNYHTGVLMKRRRKKGQGYARRFFSLDYATCTLSYYHNRNSSALRGAIPLSLAAIAADERRREISIDSGAEIWHLKASNDREFIDWAKALEKSSRIARGLEPLREPSPVKRQVTRRSLLAPPNTQQEEDREWQQVEALVSRVVGTRDALRRLVKDMAANNKSPCAQRPISAHLSPATPAVAEDEEYFTTPTQEKRSFWKRKSSASIPTQASFQSSVSSALAVPSPNTVTTTITASANGAHKKQNSKGRIEEERTTRDHCNALLSDLDTVVLEFSALLSNSKRRRMPIPASAASRNSIESTTSDEFFDAEEAGDRSQILVINHTGEDEALDSDVEENSVHGSSSVSSVDDADEQYVASEGAVDLFPAKPKSLVPLPVKETVERRQTIAPSTVLPPSLIAFVRKNVGKDLSTISMPVSANEPTSLLQRVAEQLEYADLLDAASQKREDKDRMLYVAAFAVSQFSGGRAKERAIRKPFNPLLGETYELVRSDTEVPGGLRLLVEKVTHRPVRLAMQADSALWSFAQSPAPIQKFWGKSAEITTDGRVRVVLHLPDNVEERYSWNIATVFLRNVVMGEKYVEPVGSMSVVNDSTGAKATIEFRSKGMFGGRGEDVQVETYGPDGVHTGASLSGTWTNALSIVEAGKAAGSEIWRVRSLVDNASNTYGLTTFAAGLNEITPLEKGKLPPTDTRLRPDQRLAEEGKLDDAEAWKVKLEEAQRVRRRVLEEKGIEHRPRWFVPVAGTGGEGVEEVWKMKGGKDGYWEERARGNWLGVEDIFSG